MDWRPDVEFDEFLDASGTPIPYGELWEDGSPADDSYSHTAHPERFEVAWTLARALVDHLVAEYDVEVIPDVDPCEGRAAYEGAPTPRGALDGAPPAVRRIVPRGSGAPLTVVETEHPGVVIYAGATLVARAPICGCDACDERVHEMADSLEELALAVADGAAWERAVRRGVAHGLEGADAPSRGWEQRPRDQRRQVRAAIAAAPEFAPWPPRGSRHK